jgi:hypothetical protein
MLLRAQRNVQFWVWFNETVLETLVYSHKFHKQLGLNVATQVAAPTFGCYWIL